MSFSSLVKEELSRVRPEKYCCMLSELSALTQTCGSMRLSGGGRVKVVYETENPALAKRIFLLLKNETAARKYLSMFDPIKAQSQVASQWAMLSQALLNRMENRNQTPQEIIVRAKIVQRESVRL